MQRKNRQHFKTAERQESLMPGVAGALLKMLLVLVVVGEVRRSRDWDREEEEEECWNRDILTNRLSTNR